MASFSAVTTFTDGVANDVTAAKLAALVNNATPTSGLIQDRTAETVVGSNDTFLIGDASDSNNLKRITVANVMKAELTGSVNSTAGTIGTATLGTTTGTAATFTNGTITTGVIPNLTAGTTTGTAATITSLTAGTTTSTAAVITSITSGTGTASAPAISPTGDSNTGIFFPAADTTAFSEGGVEAMRIDSTGRLILGNGDTSATPTSGTLRVTNSSGSNVAGSNLTFEAGSSTGTSSGGFMAFRTTGTGINGTVLNSSTERLRIDSSGNVGIGVSSLSDKFTVRGTTGVAATIDMSSGISTGTEYGSLKFTASSPNFTGAEIRGIHTNGGTNQGVLAFHTSATERLRIDSSGNVGIGTTSPTGIGSNYTTLDLRGSSGGGVGFGSTSAGQFAQIYAVNSDSSLRIQNTSASGFTQFTTNNTERLRIDSSGFVSIGTATGLSALHVHGNVTLSNTTTATSAGTGGLSKPATYAGYLTVSINGTSRKIPYYAT